MSLYHDGSELSCNARDAPIERFVDASGNETLEWSCGCAGARPYDANPLPAPEPLEPEPEVSP